jgi:hypothetical protein
LVGALSSYHEDLRIRETLAARDLNNTEWQRDLIVSLVKLGTASGESTLNALANAFVGSDGRVAGVALWRSPIVPTESLVDRFGVAKVFHPAIADSFCDLYVIPP